MSLNIQPGPHFTKSCDGALFSYFPKFGKTPKKSPSQLLARWGPGFKYDSIKRAVSPLLVDAINFNFGPPIVEI